MTRIEPMTNWAEITKPNINVDRMVETTIAIEVAKPAKLSTCHFATVKRNKPLIMLSAYLITTATNKPPKAWFITTA